MLLDTAAAAGSKGTRELISQVSCSIVIVVRPRPLLYWPHVPRVLASVLSSRLACGFYWGPSVGVVLNARGRAASVFFFLSLLRLK